MSGAADTLAVVLLVFFLIGAGVGVVVVIAMSARRMDEYPSEDETEDEPDDDEPNEPEWWQSRDGQ
jgi:hypothetical protein